MSQTELSYEELKRKIIEELKKHTTGTLATSEDGYVTARVLGILPDGLTIYCFVDVNSRKCKQINANPKVALTAGNIQIEGIARLRGQPLDDENAYVIDLFKRTLPDIFENFSRKYFSRASGDGRVLEISSKRATLFVSDSLEILNVEKEKAYRVPLFDIKDSPVYNE